MHTVDSPPVQVGIEGTDYNGQHNLMGGPSPYNQNSQGPPFQWAWNSERMWQNSVEKPKFDGKINPVNFEEQLDKYLRRWVVPNHEH